MNETNQMNQINPPYRSRTSRVKETMVADTALLSTPRSEISSSVGKVPVLAQSVRPCFNRSSSWSNRSW